MGNARGKKGREERKKKRKKKALTTSEGVFRHILQVSNARALVEWLSRFRACQERKKKEGRGKKNEGADSFTRAPCLCQFGYGPISYFEKTNQKKKGKGKERKGEKKVCQVRPIPAQDLLYYLYGSKGKKKKGGGGGGGEDERGPAHGRKA